VSQPRVALLGVGLIGGSIGLAARRRLGAHVVGWNRSPAALDTALASGAIDEAAATLDDLEGADVAIASVSIDALPGAVRDLCDRLPGAVVSDVGSTKQSLVEAVDREHFIGGHPLAGAETTGVAHAREDLFDGATWYLTPGRRTPGVLYERLARFVAGLGAVPTAIAPGDHDRLMAAVSHLPHVVANLLVAQAAEALGGETMPATGPSFRDATRVAGANPALWEQIYRANSAALGRQIDDLVRRLGEVRGLLQAGDGDGAADGGLGAWQGRAAEQRAALLEVGLTGGSARELRVAVPNKPGVVAQIALALGRAGINISDMSLAPEADNRAGMIGLWVRAADAERAIELVAELGYPAA
jgi:prephenate dehydrogenase